MTCQLPLERVENAKPQAWKWIVAAARRADMAAL
jgi:hypothetical protein